MSKPTGNDDGANRGSGGRAFDQTHVAASVSQLRPTIPRIVLRVRLKWQKAVSNHSLDQAWTEYVQTWLNDDTTP